MKNKRPMSDGDQLDAAGDLDNSFGESRDNKLQKVEDSQNSQESLKMVKPFHFIPLDVTQKLLSRLPPSDLARAAKVDKLFNMLVYKRNSNLFWRNYFNNSINKFNSNDGYEKAEKNWIAKQFIESNRSSFDNADSVSAEDLKNLMCLSSNALSILGHPIIRDNQPLLDKLYDLVNSERKKPQFSPLYPLDRLSALEWVVICNQLHEFSKFSHHHHSGAEQFTPLNLACYLGRLEFVKLMLEQWGDPITRGDQLVPLSAAAMNAQLAVVEFLVERKGENIQPHYSYGKSPVVIAAENGHENIVQLLMDKGQASYEQGFTLAVRYGFDNLLRSLLVTRSPNFTYNGSSPIHVAAIRRTMILQLLLDHHADIDAIDSKQYTALHIAVNEGNESAVTLLLKKGANPNIANLNQQTPLHLAVILGNLRLIELLLSYCANIEAVDSEGNTPLITAAISQNIKVVELLLSNAAKPNVQCRAGRTPLYYSALNANINIMIALLAKGADINLVDTLRSSLLHVAISRNDVAFDTSRIETIKFLILKCASVDAPCARGFTPLFIAAEKGLKEVVDILLDQGVDPQASITTTQQVLSEIVRTKSNQALMRMNSFLVKAKTESVKITPIEVAVIIGHTEIAERLISIGQQNNFHRKCS